MVFDFPQLWAVGKGKCSHFLNCNIYSKLRCHSLQVFGFFFQRSSERRVLLIVGVCFASSHLHIFSSSHLLILASSHHHMFTSSHLQIFSSSHHHIFASSYLHIFASFHLRIFSSSYLRIFSSSHHNIFASSHLCIFSFSHRHIFSSSHLQIFSSSHILSLFFLLSCFLAVFAHRMEHPCSIAKLVSCCGSGKSVSCRCLAVCRFIGWVI